MIMFGNRSGFKDSRYFLTLMIVAAALLGASCIHKVNVNELLAAGPPLRTDELINRINAYSRIQSFSAKADVTVWNYFTGEGAKADEFPAATGLIRFKRPDETRMNVTFIGAK